MPTRQEFDEASRTIHAYLKGLEARATGAEARTRELESARDQRQAEVDGLARERDAQRAALTHELARTREAETTALARDVAAAKDELARTKAAIADRADRKDEADRLRGAIETAQREVAQLGVRKHDLALAVADAERVLAALRGDVQRLEGQQAELEAAREQAKKALGVR